ncbi:hypothetical protein PK28_02340 [Hymenobacter sp. DG25B]|uniref:XrtX-associated membrane protein n=1 Tax=Hymenobacter sp. DG25B TaxID=1385664 RepID=UPI000540E105|nr:hypothetical protein [Hymenobacter sp. DG25B]AIZ62810.1 hypothetical protein PK28_02340 [Hymenobacter sp. DG25B]
MHSPGVNGRLSRILRKLVLLLLGSGLFVLGQFDEQVFTGLARLWRAGMALMGPAGQYLLQAGTHTQLTSHGMPVALTYRVLYLGLSILLLRVLLRGRFQWQIVLAYAGAFLTGCMLLAVGQGLHLQVMSLLAHQLIDFLCSPLAVLLAYPLLVLAEKESALLEVKNS